ncbi:MAG: hypothetical protein ACJA1C_000090 [Crocinitomicaceae bacterium]|jgi:hypothetical protein
MKLIISLAFGVVCLQSTGQVDQSNFLVSPSIGFVTHIFDDVYSAGGTTGSQGYSSALNFKHHVVRHSGLNIMINVGLHHPLLKGQTFSAGIRPVIGVGTLRQLSQSTEVNYEQFEDRKINAFSAHAILSGYVRYNLYQNQLIYANVTAQFGYRLALSYNNYQTPFVQLEIGTERWSIGGYYNLIKKQFYRELSNGDLEVNQSHNELGIIVNFLIPRISKEQEQDSK